MVLVARVLWVMVAFLIACTTAAMVITLGLVLPELSDSAPIPAGQGTIWWVVGLSTVLISGFALIPAMLVIALAEGFRLRSFVFYAFAAGAMALFYQYGWRGGISGPPRAFVADHDSEVVAASGIAAGLVYWVLAGRRAGEWRSARPSSRALPPSGRT